MRASAILGIAAVLGGCAAAGVPFTADPAEKLAHAAELTRAGRPIPAERLIAEALKTFQDQGNELGLATVYFAYGNFYKSDGYHHSQESAFFERNGELAGAYERSAAYFKKAATIMRGLGHFPDVASALAGAAYAHRSGGNLASACASYAEVKAVISEKALGAQDANHKFLTEFMAQFAKACDPAAQQGAPADGPRPAGSGFPRFARRG